MLMRILFIIFLAELMVLGYCCQDLINPYAMWHIKKLADYSIAGFIILIFAWKVCIDMH